MYADICDPNDERTFERFQNALKTLKANLVRQSCAMGVDVYDFIIDGQQLIVFRDAWSVDVQGSAELIQRVRDELAPGP